MPRQSQPDTSQPAARTAKPPAPLRLAEAGNAAFGRLLNPSVADRIDAARGGGSGLPGALRVEMEEAFGADFSGVRVHTGSEADELSRSVSAQAFTTGSDIFFSRGAFDPAGGRELIAHELTHVVQQASGRSGAPGRVSDPGDAHEVEARAVAARVVAGQPAGVAAAAGSCGVHRFQAGVTGHGGIEEDVLRSLHVPEDEIGKVYIGNWMRDFSQAGNPHEPNTLLLLNVLSMGEFNRPVEAEQVGGYLPSEHLDNPRGGGSPEERSSGTEGFESLSQAQQQWVLEQRTDAFRSMIAERAAHSHLPGYVEVGKENARRHLERAVLEGREGTAGPMELGSALHVVEDYFAHSNFADACVYLLVNDGSVPADHPVAADLQARATRFAYDPSGLAAGGARPEIVTGTYREANKTVSLLETLHSEVEHGTLSRALVLGALRTGLVKASDLGADLGSGVLGGGLGAAGALGGFLAEGVNGAVEGWRAGDGFGALLDAVIGLGNGAVEGAEVGWEAGQEAGGDLGARIGRVVGHGAGAAVETAAVAAVLVLIAEALAAAAANPEITLTALAAGGAAADHFAGEEAVNTAVDAASAADRAAGDLGANHSQLAKDGLDHPAFDVARALAVHADTQITQAVLAAWASGQNAVPVTRLVDEFVANPADVSWWRPIALEALNRRR